MPLTSRGLASSPPAQSATTQFQDLLALVAGVGPGKSLEKKLHKAFVYYLANDNSASCSALSGFLHEVDAQDGKKIDPQTALSILAQTDALRGTIGC